MHEYTFDQAVDEIRSKIYAGQHDQDYIDAVNTLVFLWDQDRVNQINKTVLPRNRYKNVRDGELYLVFRIRPLTYMKILRNKHVMLVH